MHGVPRQGKSWRSLFESTDSEKKDKKGTSAGEAVKAAFAFIGNLPFYLVGMSWWVIFMLGAAVIVVATGFIVYLAGEKAWSLWKNSDEAKLAAINQGVVALARVPPPRWNESRDLPPLLLAGPDTHGWEVMEYNVKIEDYSPPKGKGPLIYTKLNTALMEDGELIVLNDHHDDSGGYLVYVGSPEEGLVRAQGSKIPFNILQTTAIFFETRASHPPARAVNLTLKAKLPERSRDTLIARRKIVPRGKPLVWGELPDPIEWGCRYRLYIRYAFPDGHPQAGQNIPKSRLQVAHTAIVVNAPDGIVSKPILVPEKEWSSDELAAGTLVLNTPSLEGGTLVEVIMRITPH